VIASMDYAGGLQISADDGVPVMAQRLLRQAAVEVTPGDYRGLDSIKRLLGRGSRVYIASVGRHGHDQTISTANRLSHDGFVPIPHIAARRLGSKDELGNLLRALRPLTDEVLLIGGDLAKPVGPFVGAADLLKSGVLVDCAFRRVGIAGYPEGHKVIDNGALAQALTEKLALARSSNLEIYIVSQFCFDASAIAGWERRIRQFIGGSIEVHIGIPGVTALGKLLRFATLCGAGASVRFLRRNAYHMARLATAWLPDALVIDISRFVQSDPECQISQFHLFPFGGVDASLRWLKAAQSGFLDVAVDQARN